MKKTLVIFYLFELLSCSDFDKTQSHKLTNHQKAEIEQLSITLVNSINENDYSVINNSWGYENFKKIISKKSTKTQRSVLNHIFEKDLRMMVKSGNLSIIHRVSSDNGKVSVLSIHHFDEYSELVLLLKFEGVFDVFKYKLEIHNNKPVISDYFSYSDNLWYSQKVLNSLKLNSKYDAFSEERVEANSAIQHSQNALKLGDTLEALYSLYTIPESHAEGNWLSMKKIEIAMPLGDSILAIVLETELENNQSLYMKYLYNYYFGDSIGLNQVHQSLLNSIGQNQLLDSVIREGYLWNISNE